MVKQGDIIGINFTPQADHEQAGYRPAVVISNDFFNSHTRLAIVCLITSNTRPFPLHLPLDERTRTQGVIMCEQVKALDLRARTYTFFEKLPEDLLQDVINVVFAEIEIQ